MILNIINRKLSKYEVALTRKEISNLIPNVEWIKDGDYA